MFSCYAYVKILDFIPKFKKVLTLETRNVNFRLDSNLCRVAVIGAKNHKRRRRKRQSVTAKRE